MSIAILTHSVADFDAWKAGFDAAEVPRENSGAINYRVFRNLDDPCLVTIQADLTDRAQFEAFSASPELKEAMEKAGVTSPPQISFWDEAK